MQQNNIKIKNRNIIKKILLQMKITNKTKKEFKLTFNTFLYICTADAQ